MVTQKDQGGLTMGLGVGDEKKRPDLAACAGLIRHALSPIRQASESVLWNGVFIAPKSSARPPGRQHERLVDWCIFCIKPPNCGNPGSWSGAGSKTPSQASCSRRTFTAAARFASARAYMAISSQKSA
jgi:hypothetical protein